jgi:hypothetical protein
MAITLLSISTKLLGIDSFNNPNNQDKISIESTTTCIDHDKINTKSVENGRWTPEIEFTFVFLPQEEFSAIKGTLNRIYTSRDPDCILGEGECQMKSANQRIVYLLK